MHWTEWSKPFIPYILVVKCSRFDFYHGNHFIKFLCAQFWGEWWWCHKYNRWLCYECTCTLKRTGADEWKRFMPLSHSWNSKWHTMDSSILPIGYTFSIKCWNIHIATRIFLVTKVYVAKTQQHRTEQKNVK